MKRQPLRTLRGKARRLIKRFLPRATILLYHRVAELPSDPQLLAVTPRHFAEHLEILRRDYRPVRLAATDKPTRRSVVVTFDDGYADNLLHAKPLLARHDVPATVFVTSGYVGRHQTFWWDELETLLLQSERLPETVELNIDGATYRWGIGSSNRACDLSLRDCGSWNVAEEQDPTPRHTAYRALHRMLRPLPDAEQQSVLRQLRALAGETLAKPGDSRPLSSAELIDLEREGLVEVGAHTVTHPVLSSLPLQAQAAEIERSKADLEKILGRRITSFAYPFGGREDYSAQTVAAVRRAGYERACSNFAGFVQPNTDRYQLPRFLVRDWDGDQFQRQLQQWLAN